MSRRCCCFAGLLLGLVEPGHLSIKPAYIGVFVGGLLLGVGFAVAGYCPGTGLTAMASGRSDAFFFVIGGLFGAAAYMLSYGAVKATGLLDAILGGKTTLGALTTITKFPAFISGVNGEMLGLGVGVALIAIAWLLPDRLSANPRPVPAE